MTLGNSECRPKIGFQGNLNLLFKKIFPDTKIASEVALGFTKITYIAHFGIFLYFKIDLNTPIVRFPVSFLFFDESFNEAI